MSRSRRLQQVKEFIVQREEEAARAMTQAARELEQAQAQLEALQRFRRDYAARLQREGESMSALQLHEYRVFLANLGGAIEEQETILQKMRQQYAALERTWRQAHCRSQGIKKFQDKLRQQEEHVRERRQQSEVDDRSATRYSRSRWK